MTAGKPFSGKPTLNHRSCTNASSEQSKNVILKRIQKCGVENVCTHQNRNLFYSTCLSSTCLHFPPTPKKEIAADKMVLF